MQLNEITLSEAKQYIDEEHFRAGSMLPKVQACMNVVNDNPSVNINYFNR